MDRIYYEWDKALSDNDPDALLRLYAPDAVLESPLIPHLMDSETGVCRGHQELRALFEKLVKRKPPVRQYYRTPYFTDGKKLMWEYPRATDQGDQNGFCRGGRPAESNR
jgi:hypothetical protein